MSNETVKPLVAIIILIVAAVLMWRAINWFLGTLPPDNCSTMIRIKDGRCAVSKGVIDSTARRQIAELVEEAGIRSGFIAVAGGRVRFSTSIPGELHQRFRNVILNS